MGKKALVLWGGWDGHTPKETAELLAGEMQKKGITSEIVATLDPLADGAKLKTYDLIVPVWTCGQLSGDQWKGLNEAVKSGVGVGGVHGGTGDAFRGCIEYQWMIGGQFVGHPHVGDYEVRLTKNESPITECLKKKFKYTSEQYYMLIDPGATVLAETSYVYEEKKCKMPVIWTKTWGQGRVFYSALGHTAEELKKYPEVVEMSVRGLAWAAR